MISKYSPDFSNRAFNRPLVRSNSAYKGWCTKYRKEIALLKKEQIDLRMAYDKHVNGTQMQDGARFHPDGGAFAPFGSAL